MNASLLRRQSLRGVGDRMGNVARPSPTMCTTCTSSRWSFTYLSNLQRTWQCKLYKSLGASMHVDIVCCFGCGNFWDSPVGKSPPVRLASCGGRV
jgi:hypothetical protein